MILYKNVDILDLMSIMEKGLLSIDKCGNDNWGYGKRSDNSTSVVYLFKPIGEKNVFPNYGVALLEIDCDNAVEHKMSENDAHKDDYIEYTVDEISPKQIKKIIIPKILKDRISIPENIKVTWCDICADVFDENEKSHFRQASQEDFEQFAKTAPLDTEEFNFFRGIKKNNTMLDLYNVKYVWR